MTTGRRTRARGMAAAAAIVAVVMAGAALSPLHAQGTCAGSRAVRWQPVQQCGVLANGRYAMGEHLCQAGWDGARKACIVQCQWTNRCAGSTGVSATRGGAVAVAPPGSTGSNSGLTGAVAPDVAAGGSGGSVIPGAAPGTTFENPVFQYRQQP